MRQALVSSTGTFWDTVVVCALTGLVVVNSGDWTRGHTGALLTKEAFSEFPTLGPLVLTVGLLTFVFSTILGWCYYGEKAAEYLLGARAVLPYRYLWVAALEIVEHDALDATTGSEKPEKAGKAKGVVSDVLSTMPALSAEEREFLDELGVNVEDLFRQAGEVKSAFERIESENLEDHQKIYLWGRLHSTTRTALKKEGEARRIKEAA